jgi:hypothetical protein
VCSHSNTPLLAAERMPLAFREIMRMGVPRRMRHHSNHA